MALSLKAINSAPLYGLMAINFVVYLGFARTGTFPQDGWAALLESAGTTLPAAVGVALTGVANALISSATKARIVFLRWNDPLPGAEAFSKYGPDDPRVDMAELARRFGPLPKKAKDQNVLWYRLYLLVESNVTVLQVHRAFLLARDYACLSLMLVFVLGIAGCTQIPTTTGTALYIGLLVLQFVLAGQAARTHGRRFVSTVLALNSARK